MLEKPRAPRVISNFDVTDPQIAVDGDTTLLRQVQVTGQPTLRIWQNSKCLVVTRPITGHCGFSNAAQLSAQRGWPVVQRQSGGSCVFHGPSVLNVSLATHFSQPFRPDDAYACLFNLIVQKIGAFVPDLQNGHVTDAYCDGAHNIVVHGKKLAGTAVRTARKNGGVYALIHASINLFPAPRAALAAIDAFESELAGKSIERDHSKVTSLAEQRVDLSVDAEGFRSLVLGQFLS